MAYDSSTVASSAESASDVAPATSAHPYLDIRSIAVIGASEDQGKFGGRLFRNLIRHGFSGAIYPINPTRASLFDHKAYPDLHALPEAPDAIVLTLPGKLGKEQVAAAAEMGARFGIVISSGFSDAGPEGKQLEDELVAVARRAGMRLLGPNCLGMISPAKGIVLCSSPILERDHLPQRPIGFVSQSGALMSTVFDRAWSQGSGFSHGFSVGNQADLELCDFIDFMVGDDDTSVICAYVEGVKDGPRFLESARRAREAGKPLLVAKAGRSEAGQAAAFSHTASIAGDAAVFEAVCREQGALVVDDIGSMLSVADYLATQPRRALRKVAIVSPSGGGAALAADAVSDVQLPLAQLGEASRELLSEHYPAAQIKNPLDFGTRVTRDETASAQATARALQQEPEVDAVLCVTAMAPVAWQLQVCEEQAVQAAVYGKPVIVGIDAGQTSDPVRARLAELGIPYTNSTTEAVHALAKVRQWQGLQLSKGSSRPLACPDAARQLASGQYDEHLTKALLADYGIATNQGEVVASADEAVAAAGRIGYPIVLKIVSPDIVHKSDAGGVLVRLNTPEDVRRGYETMRETVAAREPGARIDGVLVQRMLDGDLEVIVGGRNDKVFGPVVLFGAGGVLVELLPDRHLATAPISPEDALRGLQALKIGRMLDGYRGKKLAVDALIDTIVRVSWLMNDLRDRDFEIDLNPVLVGADHATAVDARLLIG